MNIDDKKEVAGTLYEINGGLIFIGTVVSIILFIGTFLMMYYKNVAEGYEDRKNYQIMQHVGIDNDRIKDTINKTNYMDICIADYCRYDSCHLCFKNNI